MKTRGTNTCFICTFSTDNLPTYIRHVGNCIFQQQNTTIFPKRESTIPSSADTSTLDKKSRSSADSCYNYSAQVKKSKFFNSSLKSNLSQNRILGNTTRISENENPILAKNLKVCRNEENNLKFKIIKCDNYEDNRSSKPKSPKSLAIRSEDARTIDYQCPYCLRLFYTQSKMERHVVKCAQLKTTSVLGGCDSSNDLVKRTSMKEGKVNEEVEFLSSIHSKRKCYIKALKSLKEDEEISVPKDTSQHSSSYSKFTQPGMKRSSNQDSFEYVENNDGNNGIQTCLECNYVTYRKWDLDRHFNEKHSFFEDFLD